jgi:diguanylate cyclase (GGDEF)-like protein
MDLEALEHGLVQLRRRPTEVAGLLARAAEAAAVAARESGVTLVVGEATGESTVLADPERLARAAGALLEAILSAGPRGRRVTARVHGSPEAVTVSVEAALARRLSRRRRHEEGLSSVGLAVARRLAELHGGTLEVGSDARGVHASMTIPSAAVAAQPSPAAAAGARPRLLVVDDDDDARETLGMMLADEYEVVLAADGQEALERAGVERLDAVLMDLYMPRMDGLSALEAMRGDPATAEVPVILISARGDELTRSRSLDLGAVDFLQKPFSSRELKGRIERTLRLTRRETELQQLARTDPLTGLANVRAFRSRLEEEVKRARRYRTPLACVMVDMDRLKPINDEMGHAAGDVAIRAVADVIRRELRETDFGARYGGDEFVLLLPHTSGVEARVFAERVAHRLDQSPVELPGRRIPLSASFGIAALESEPEETGDALVRRADAALYAAKRGGRGTVVSHGPDAGDEAQPAT